MNDGGGVWIEKNNVEKKVNKRNREEEEAIDNELQLFQGVLRDRDESLHVTLDYDFNFEPPLIARLLAFNFKYKEKKILELISKIKAGECNEHWEETENCTQKLSNMIKADARLVDELEHDFLYTLVELLKRYQHPKLQAHAANILRYVIAYSSNNKNFVMKHVTTFIVLNLMSSQDYKVQEEAVWILRTIALAFPDKALLEGYLEPLGSLLADSTIEEVLYGGAEALQAICQVHPKLPSEKLKYVVLSLLKLLESVSEDIVSAACTGLALLCDGTERMVVDKQDFEPLIDHIVDFIDSDSRVKTLGGLIALGSIARWGNDDDIELYSTPLEQTITAKDGSRFVLVLYALFENAAALFENAAEARVKVTLTSDVKSPFDLWGVISARTSAIEQLEYSSLLFFKDPGEKIRVTPEEEIVLPLSRSLAAVPLGEQLILDFGLCADDNDKLVQERLSFDALENGKTPVCDTIWCCKFKILVEVSWRYKENCRKGKN